MLEISFLNRSVNLKVAVLHDLFILCACWLSLIILYLVKKNYYAFKYDSKILEKTDVSAIGRKSFNKIYPFFLGIGTYLVNFKISGNVPFSRLWRGFETTSAISWIILWGISSGPVVDFFKKNLRIILSSLTVVGYINMVLWLYKVEQKFSASVILDVSFFPHVYKKLTYLISFLPLTAIISFKF